jgi:anti-sigma28 factor (negative regulator of flagellin synthesis)
VFGRTDIKAGQTVTYKTPKTGEIVKKEIETSVDSDYFTGKYLITAIKHTIVNGQHKMDMEIVSDSFVTNISNTK